MVFRFHAGIVKKELPMLIEYVNKGMSKAVYEKLEDGSYYGRIPQAPGAEPGGRHFYMRYGTFTFTVIFQVNSPT